MSIDISFVLTVYNKRNYLEHTIQSLQNQKGDFSREFIFVDDCSTDDSIAVIERNTKEMVNVNIIRNSDNKGPSVRLNQGARQAKGKFLYLLDADDIIPNNAAAKMSEILLKERADVIYGKSHKIYSAFHKFVNRSIDGDPLYTVSNHPFEYILKGGFVRMGLMTTKELYIRSGGCDERIFIQDESLPINLCSKANKLIDYAATVLFWIAKGDEKNSANELQLQHDGFLAYLNAINDINLLSQKVKITLQTKMISVTWKSVRLVKTFPYINRFFADYLSSKIRKKTNSEALKRAEMFYATLEGVRRL